MQSHHVLDRQPRLAAALVVIVLLVCPRSGAGQITPDGTLGTAVSNTGNAYTVNGGRSVGNNLFHSFGDFNVPTSGSATFNGAASTANVLSRVTGGLPSSIDGVISTRAGASPMPNANFFLINPAGVMFGAGASVDVGGTFHASSSNRIFLQDGIEFSATPGPGDALLSSAPPQAFGFLGSSAAITTDGTLGTVVDDAGGDNYSISGGTYKEFNLFHSFGLFSVPELGSAIFEGLPATQNVISRVTGGSPSSIDSFISTRAGMSPMLAANFFLINPAGVMFGPGAVLDVGGSVHISTADQLIFPDHVFSAAPQPNELNLLSSALPQAFGFLADNPAGIDVNGAQLFVDPHDGVAGRTLSLVGGDITVRGGAALFAPGGLIRLVSVASPGNVNFGSADLGLASFAEGGVVRIAEDSVVIAGGSDFGVPGPGGSVVIRSGQLVVESGGWVLSDTADSGAPQVGVDIQAKDSVAVSGGGLIWTSSSGSDNASGISIATDNLTITGGGAIQSLAGGTGGSGAIDIQVGNAAITGGTIQTFSEAGNAGNIAIAATGTVTLSGPASEISSGTVDALGNNAVAGNISVTAADIVLSDQAQIRSGSAFQQAGKVTVSATNTLSISSLAGILSRTFSVAAGPVEISARQLVIDRGFITTSTFGARDAGPVMVNADTVSLMNGAQIASSSQLGAPGAAGSVTINAPGSVTISGVAPDLSVSDITFSGTSSSGVFSTAQGSGDAGQVSVLTPQLTLANGARISVATTSTGDAGAILANVGALSITGGARVDSSTTAAGAGGSIIVNGTLSIAGAGSGLFSTASSTGNAGAITVTGPGVTVTGGGRIDSSTTAAGAGGAIGVNGTLSINGAGSGLFSTTEGAGNAGQITLSSPVLTLADGGRISVTTEGAGNAGTIVANVGSFGISGGARVDSSTSSGGAGGAIIVNGTLSIGGAGSGLFSTASSTGNAGAVNVTAPSVTVADGGTIDSSTTGAGAGGAIELNAASQVEIASGGSIRADSLGSGLTGNITITAGDQIVMNDGSISTRAVSSDGGNITLRAPNVIRLGDSQITTSVESGTGSGGNIFIDPKLVLLQGSTITANAFGGPGGSITIIADNFVTDAASLVQASSALSTPGTIRIQSPENNLKEAIAQLPGELVDASRLMRAGCAARHTGATSSLAVAGRGGVPADADGYLPSFSTTGAPLARAARQEERAPRFALAMASWDCLR